MSKGKNPCKDYKLLEIIGRGKFGTVHKAIHTESKQVIAIKILNLDTDHEEVKDIQQEIQFLSNLKSISNITHYFGSYLNGHKLWILMDYCSGGSVRTLLKPGPLQEKYIAVITRELLIALQFIHEHGVIHRDIKAANILINKDGNVKLCDFGVAAQLTSTAVKRTTMAGTPYWMAPEVITEGATYNVKADIWSTGITIYEMATGNPPYSDKDALRAMQYITQHEPSRLEGRQYGPLLKEIVAMCLEEKQDVRPTTEDLLKSRFIKSSKTFPTSLLKELIGKYLVWGDSRTAITSAGNMKTITEVPEGPDGSVVPEIDKIEPTRASFADDSSIVGEEGEDIKWDFDSLKSAEYILENDIDLKEENHQFDDFDLETNNNKDFITSPYNRTFTIGNTLMNSHVNDTRVNSTMTGTHTGTHNISSGVGNSTALSSQIDSIINSQSGSAVKIEPPKSLMRLFQTEEEISNENNIHDSILLGSKSVDSMVHGNGHKIDYSMVNTDEINTGKIDLSAALGGHQPSHEIRHPIVSSPLVSIEIPNIEVIENEIQEREKQRSRATTVNNNANITTKVESLISDQPLPIRKPTLTMTNRTPSPARGLEQINTSFQTSPSKQSSPLHMKPLTTNSQQPLLQPINNLKMKPQINLTGISNHKGVNGPQTAPVSTLTNSEMLDSSIRARTQMRIQMPKPVSATTLNFNNMLKDNINSKNDFPEKNQFGFDVSAASSLPLAMTPVTERPNPTSNVTPEKESNKPLDVSSGYTVTSSQPSNLSHKLSFSTSNSTNSGTISERKMSFETTTRYPTHANESIQLRNNSVISTHDDSDKAADVTLTNENLSTTTSMNTDNLVTGLGMMTISDTGKASPLRMNSITQKEINRNNTKDKLIRVLSMSQMNVNRVTNYGLGMSESQTDEGSIEEFYIKEIENLLGNMDDLLKLTVSELN
ncbi:hypothetical protein CANINC_002631 [Pichia inconspicua]|uniref:non-specific serine/threonine protein kinase n=1 Tax=Pichia inconspicua TaxID=52247 RepID=A0A4T0X204_9ASCO|nr:hypothetical protein CANINC_002631 [[Candida] inconspicua]